MRLQVSSNNLSHSKFKFIIIKRNLQNKFQNAEEKREKRRPLFHLFKNPKPNLKRKTTLA
ncbi:hypothetical protein HanXRQr2_Chr02g0057731 [Helianthus annuus]|uniref:Uncharacterized protein n=1 Tax=Helianthus annuus TaxID=4232 RepID=A0A9K3JLV0_HELAN|nr:hypothetical protein HanXRQr2_Chr02g0057731 [Helianthus annuus]KAJ0951204.1 hypothetical protein HanPSC8_Chr02g0057191 [Helianthus annuus]